MEKMIISGVAKDTNVARISLLELKDQPGMAFRIFSLLAKEKINVDIILQSVGRDGTKDITFTVAKENADHAVEILSKSKEQIGCKAVLCDNGGRQGFLSSAQVWSQESRVACKLFDALAQANINIDMVSTSEIKISVLIHIDDAQRAVAAIHDKFYND